MTDDITAGFQIEIDDDLIAAALASVEAREQEGSARRSTEPPPEDDSAAPPVDLDIEVEAVDEGADPDPEGDEVMFDPGEWGEPPASELDAAIERVAGLEDELEQAQEALAAAEERARVNRERAEEARERYLKLKARNMRVIEQAEALGAELNAARARLTELNGAFDEARTQVSRHERDRERMRHRLAREVDEARRFGNEKMMKELFPVLDHLELAVSHADTDPARTVEGIRMIVAQLDGTLRRLGLERIDAPRGDGFDPTLHEAISYTPHPEVAPGRVVETLRAGYTLEGRLLRAARVVVAAGSSAPATGDDDGTVPPADEVPGADEDPLLRAAEAPEE